MWRNAGETCSPEQFKGVVQKDTHTLGDYNIIFPVPAEGRQSPQSNNTLGYDREGIDKNEIKRRRPISRRVVGSGITLGIEDRSQAI